MAKDYDVLNGMIGNQSLVLQTAFDKGYKQGYEEGFSKNLAQAREEEYNKGYEARKAEESNSAKMIVNCDSDAYEKGLDDAWECARKAEYMLFNRPHFEQCFGGTDFHTVLTQMSAVEAMATIEEYEKSQETEPDNSWRSVPVDEMTEDQLRAALKDVQERYDYLKRTV